MDLFYHFRFDFSRFYEKYSRFFKIYIVKIFKKWYNIQDNDINLQRKPK